jgi:hypothetical protein
LLSPSGFFACVVIIVFAGGRTGSDVLDPPRSAGNGRSVPVVFTRRKLLLSESILTVRPVVDGCKATRNGTGGRRRTRRLCSVVVVFGMVQESDSEARHEQKMEKEYEDEEGADAGNWGITD